LIGIRTLIDTGAGRISCLSEKPAILIPVDLGLYHSFQPNWYNMYRALELPEDKWPEAEELWLGITETLRNCCPERRALDQLTRAGYSLGVVTSEPNQGSREINGLNLAAFSGGDLLRRCRE
jgi:hypothetical protein